MKTTLIIIVAALSIFLSCNQKTELTETDKKQVETEVFQFMKEFFPEKIEPMDPNKLFSYFLQNDELTVATGGALLTNPSAVLDTMKVHMSIMQKELIKDVDDKIYVVNKEAAVISSSKLITVSFKEGGEITIPVAVTMLLVKRDNKWKIVHYHN